MVNRYLNSTLPKLIIGSWSSSIGKLKLLLRFVDKEEKDELLRDIRRMILDRGFSVEEIFGNGEFLKQRHAIEPKYQNPDRPDEKWSGRGRKPGWVVSLLDQGENLDELLIGKE
uniref:DNA-binding protein H-NS n=1 Tax=Candidatus Kentrum sp. TUN TaxID=2126343 RepID=A0A450Z9M1_9GAMM|nr:MAG: DNA-binding protein H-NS [Candidatus Kentron sp. TUN]VFK51702.1 MAG: DNA-binding protein H-NS [Candidatus Kentron sp. TUN]VFK56442.1 MAG: DNA-binding protein H-NS [Candidatus Kentron sp. TUN]